MSEVILENQMAAGSLAGKYLTFTLGQGSFCIAVLKVREIIRLTHVTSLPHTPAHICGVINLRGKIIPVMDLRLCLGIPCAEATVQSRIMVVQIQSAAGPSSPMGMVVDGMEEMVNIGASDLEATPDLGIVVHADCILVLARIKGVVKTLLDIDGIVASTSAKSAALAAPSLMAA
jgi:purine-binding chemotaxis protein CheW